MFLIKVKMYEFIWLCKNFSKQNIKYFIKTYRYIYPFFIFIYNIKNYN